MTSHKPLPVCKVSLPDTALPRYDGHFPGDPMSSNPYSTTTIAASPMGDEVGEHKPSHPEETGFEELLLCARQLHCV